MAPSSSTAHDTSAAASASDKITKPAAGQNLSRSLGLFDSTMIVAGSMIGSGIFIVAGEMAREIGSSGWLMLSWVLAGVLTVAAAAAMEETP